MSPSRPFILRPVATTLLMIGILLVGFVAYRELPISALPQVDYPTIQVLTFYPGASPDVMTSSVTAPLERQFGQIPGLNQMTSTSSFGSSIVTLQFVLDLNIDVAEQEVQAAINAASNLLPQDLPNPPIYSKINPADSPIMTVALTSASLPLNKIEDLAETTLSQKISQLPGVGMVSISGGQRPAVRIQANPTQLASYGLSLEDLRLALSQANVDQAKGNFDGPHQAFTIGANDQLLTSDGYRPLIIAYRNGAPVRLSDVATVFDGAENTKQAAWANEHPAVILNIQRQPGANIIAVVDRIKKLLPQLQASLPGAVQVQILTDRTTTIRASVEDVQFSLVLTIGLVVMVIFLFLRSARATIIPALAVPLSIVGTFGVMYLLGYSLNNLSLMALTISTGFVVDDAIVMIENISRFIEEGESPLQAALKGSEQIGFTILSLTVSLIAVLIPLLFMGDIVGRLFREFAITLAVTIIVSAFVSLTLTPMMAAKLLRHQREEDQGWFYRVSERGFNSVIALYGQTLQFVLRYRTTTLLVTVGTLVATILLFIYVPKGFFPVQDTGLILGISEAPQNISFTAMAQRQQALATAILKDPAVESLTSFIGIDGTNATINSGRMQINLKPLKDRGHNISATDVIRRLQPQVAKVDGITLFMQPVQDLTVEDRVSRTEFQYSLEDVDEKELAHWVPKFIDKLRTLPELRDVASDQLNSGLLADLTIDRDTASRLGILPATIDNTLYDAFGQRQVSTMFTQLNQYHVVLEVNPQFQQDPEQLKNIYVKSSTGQQVPLSAFTHFQPGAGSLAINHQGQFPVVTLVVQPRAGHLTRRRGQRDQPGERRSRPSAKHPGDVSRHGRRVLALALERTDFDSRRDHHRLHRPRRFVRELHSPDHDYFDAAVGRRRRYSRAAAVPRRVQRHRAHRHHPVDRHRQEKRHHDDRLRARSRTQGRQDAARSDLRSVPAPLPADHDDHDGRVARRIAAGARHRRWFRTAPSTWHHDRRRIAAQPAPHALHHAGRLSLLRSTCAAGAAALPHHERR